MDKVRVVFKKIEGDIIAVFPHYPATLLGNDMESYSHIGQHGGISAEMALHLPPATSVEYGPLLSELVRVGYTDLDVGDNVTKKDLQVLNQNRQTIMKDKKDVY